MDMSAENSKAAIRSYMKQVWNEGRVDLFEEYVSKDVVPHSAPGIVDRDGMKQGLMMIRNAFPDIEFRLDDELAVDDKVIQRWTANATH